jgi:hypothetical protein
MKADLSRLNYWAKIRHSHRNKKNALDQYLRHKTELSLSVRTDQKTLKYVVSGFTTWSNATSTSLVSEFMILMCETVGGMCQGLGAPVLYKTQAPHPPLSSTSFLVLPLYVSAVLLCGMLCHAMPCHATPYHTYHKLTFKCIHNTYAYLHTHCRL